MTTVLIVDDNRMIRPALSDRLEELGYDTEVAGNGLDALEILNATTPDIIIMDIVMPEMTGIEATKKIRENPATRELPVIAFTSQSSTGHWDELFNDYLIKPFGYDTVGEIIERVLAGKRQGASAG